MEAFNFNINFIDFPEPAKGGWLESYCAQMKVKKPNEEVTHCKIKDFERPVLPDQFLIRKN